MKDYPSISNIVVNTSIYAFQKFDGSNIRAEWNPKRGFYKFGSRSRLIDESHPMLGSAIELVKTKFERDLSDIFKKNHYQSALGFFEFHGPNSAFGQHDPTDIKTLTLFDVNPFKKGILFPAEYLKLFGHLDIAQLLYQGLPTAEFIQCVKESKIPGMPLEGVVCKAANPKKTPMPIMFKIKSNAWIEKLKEYCKGDLELFERLA